MNKQAGKCPSMYTHCTISSQIYTSHAIGYNQNGYIHSRQTTHNRLQEISGLMLTKYCKGINQKLVKFEIASLPLA